MKARYLVWALLSSCIVGCSGESDSQRRGATERLHQMMIDQWNRVQADFRIVQLLDAKEYSQAEQLYATGVASPDWSLDYYFAQHDYERVREEANNSINRWIIQEAGHAQPSSLPGLYAIPERLRFLQALAVYRRTHPEPASTRYPSDGLVAPLLARACTYPPASGPTSRP